MAAFDALDIEIRPIRPGDRLAGLSLGDEKFAPLKIFLQRHAATYERQSLARTYAAFNIAENDRIAGYITIVCGESGDRRRRYRARGRRGPAPPLQYPAVKIARVWTASSGLNQ